MSEQAPKGKKKKSSGFVKLWRLSKLLLILLLCYLSWSSYQIYSAGFHDAGEKADAAMVLGAAAWHKKPSPVFEARLDHAVSLYKSGRVKKLILTGGKGKGAEYGEAEVGRDYCVQQGVPAGDIHIEMVSQTTHENVREARLLMELHGIDSVLIVSDPWHLRRASLMARDEGIEHQCSATTTSKYTSFGSNFTFFLRELFFVQIYHVFGV